MAQTKKWDNGESFTPAICHEGKENDKANWMRYFFLSFLQRKKFSTLLCIHLPAFRGYSFEKDSCCKEKMCLSLPRCKVWTSHREKMKIHGTLAVNKKAHPSYLPLHCPPIFWLGFLFKISCSRNLWDLLFFRASDFSHPIKIPSALRGKSL